MGALYTHCIEDRRPRRQGDIITHIMAGESAAILDFLNELQTDSDWVEKIGDTLYFVGIFLKVEWIFGNTVSFQIKATDRKIAEAFDRYLIGAVGKWNLVHSQVRPEARRV